MKPDFNPWPDEETTVYRYTGSHLRFPNRDVATGGELVALPDRVADHIGDSLELPVDEDAVESIDESEGTGSESDETDADDSAEGAVEEDGADESDVEGGEALVVPDGFDHDLPEDFPDELPDDYQALRALAPANGVDGNQSKADLIDELERVRDQEGE
jgi:hypothetical protein